MIGHTAPGNCVKMWWQNTRKYSVAVEFYFYFICLFFVVCFNDSLQVLFRWYRKTGARLRRLSRGVRSRWTKRRKWKRLSICWDLKRGVLILIKTFLLHKDTTRRGSQHSWDKGRAERGQSRVWDGTQKLRTLTLFIRMETTPHSMTYSPYHFLTNTPACYTAISFSLHRDFYGNLRFS